MTIVVSVKGIVGELEYDARFDKDFYISFIAHRCAGYGDKDWEIKFGSHHKWLLITSIRYNPRATACENLRSDKEQSPFRKSSLTKR